MLETILIEKKGPIAVITINRPDMGNAFAPDMYAKMTQIMKDMDKDDEVRAIVITGAGRFFSAGGDIVAFRQAIEDETYIPENMAYATGVMAKAVRECGKPVIAMINGAAAGAGASLALACDFRVMEAKAKIVMSFINMALCGDSSGMLMMHSYVGLARTTEWMALATPLDGVTCKEHGLANRLADEGCLEEETMKLAETLAAIPTKTFAYQKKLYLDHILANQEEFIKSEAKYMHINSMSADHKEAVDAFLEKRKPNFTGK